MHTLPGATTATLHSLRIGTLHRSMLSAESPLSHKTDANEHRMTASKPVVAMQKKHIYPAKCIVLFAKNGWQPTRKKHQIQRMPDYCKHPTKSISTFWVQPPQPQHPPQTTASMLPKSSQWLHQQPLPPCPPLLAASQPEPPPLLLVPSPPAQTAAAAHTQAPPGWTACTG